MEGALNFRLGQDNQRPNANGQTGDATQRARQHSDDTRSHSQAIVLKSLHLHCTHQNNSSEDNRQNTREDAGGSAHQISKSLIPGLSRPQNRYANDLE